MKQLSARLLLLLCSVLFFSSIYSQGIDSMMKVYAEDLPQQKVYVQFDKGIYRAGESIWFKAYIFAGYQPAVNSKNFFAELVDKDGNVVQRKIYPVVESSAAGNFDLPANMAAGRLTFRGYTTWMLNFDSSFIFQRNFNIVSKTGAAETASSTTTQKTTSLQFFPEGGDLVNDIESVLAFKANDNSGNPVPVSGTIVNGGGETVLSFKAVHDGLGSFAFTPVKGQQYTAKWKDDKGLEHSTPLPVAKEEGIVLNVTSNGKKKIFIVKRSPGAPANTQNVYVMAHMAQEMVYRAKVPLDKTLINSGSISVENLPAGVLQLTVFTDNWQPLAERIVMVNNHNYSFNVSLEPLGINTAIRAKNELEILATDTTLTNMSLSVTDAAISTKEMDDNIISKLLLTGDIRGFVYKPGYYFSNTSDSVASHLDLVMLTHGWRRFKWEDIVNHRRPKLKFPEDLYLSLNAKVFGITPYNPLQRDEQLIAIVRGRDSTNQIIQLPKTGADVFSMKNIMFFDTVSVSYQFARDKKLDRSAAVQFDNGMYKGYRKIDPNNLPYYFKTDKDTMMLNRTKYLAQQMDRYGGSFETGNVLQGVTVKTKAKSRAEELDEKYASGLFKGDAFTFDMSENFSLDILTYLQGRVPGLMINNNGGNVNISWRNSATSIFINEINAQPDQLLNLSPADIAYVKVFRPPFFGAMGGGAGGAIAVYTRKGGDVKVEPGKGLNRTQVVGYSYAKQFYSPDYSTRSASSDVAADYRSTLYWNPYIFMDGSKKAYKFQFYNNDVTKSFRVVLEGVNDVGKIVRIEKIVQ